MTWPAPPPAPQPHPPGGPHPSWQPKTLIAYARSLGFRRVAPRFTGDSAVWKNTTWRIEAAVLRTVVEVRVHRRNDLGRLECWDMVGEFFAASTDQCFATLSAFGVLPSPIGEAA